MSLSRTYSAMIHGLSAIKISVEIDTSLGLHSFSIVGLGDRAVGEAKDRISAAIKNSGYVSPKQKNQKVVISLAPADIRKEGPLFDLAMAIGYLRASGDIQVDSKEFEHSLFLGELSLEGYVRNINGIVPIICFAESMGFKKIYIPYEQRRIASIAHNIEIIPVKTLKETVSILHGQYSDHDARKFDSRKFCLVSSESEKSYKEDMCHIVGNARAKRGLEIAAVGEHNVIMYGPPGTGKTMLAKSFGSILPPLDEQESREVTMIHSVAGIVNDRLIQHPPYRSPHHTASYVSMIGGGAIPKPGEITLAHKGVLFLDELPEFSRDVIESLREPLESRRIVLSRARGTIEFPSRFILIGAMNLCPCGKGGIECACTSKSIARYNARISESIADRIDIWINVDQVDYKRLGNRHLYQEEFSADIRERVIRARNMRKARETEQTHEQINNNASNRSLDLLSKSAESLRLSARSFNRVLNIARSIADLEGSDEVKEPHILEALSFRRKN